MRDINLHVVHCSASPKMTEEVWKSCHANYSASNLGRIRNNSTNKVLKNYVAKTGYCVVNLFENKKSKQYYVHRLVAMSFLGGPPEGKNQVAHSDGKRDNPKLSNLRWVSQSENELDKRAHGTNRINHKPARKLQNCHARMIRACAKDVSFSKLGRMYNISCGNIGAIIKKRTYRDA